MYKLLTIAIIVTGLANSSYGQATASATATATIIAPIAISQVDDMNFGNIAVSDQPGEVILSTDGSCTSNGGVTIPATTGTVTAAEFTVTGEDGYTYVITLPTTYTITRASGSETMTVTDFTSDPLSTGLLTAGSQTLLVGATLNVAGSQVAGVYTNATGFDVTVNYN